MQSSGWFQSLSCHLILDVPVLRSNFVFSRLERHRSLPSLQPFCPIVTKCTREVVGFNSLADVLKRLDFRSAVHDIRVFGYVAAILKILVVPDRFYQLSGASQIFILR